MRSQLSDRRIFQRWMGLIFLFNWLLLTLIGWRYFTTPSTRPDSALSVAFAVPYLMGHVALLLALIQLIQLPLLLCWRSPFALIAGALTSTTLITVAFLDTILFDQYRFHFNPLVLELFVLGKGQIISFPASMWWTLIVGLALFLGIQLLVLWALRRWAQTRTAPWLVPIWMVLFICLVGSHLGHALAEQLGHRNIVRIARAVPLAEPLLTDFPFIERVKYQAEDGAKLNKDETGVFRYPLEPVIRQHSNRRNVLWIVVDSLRYDSLTAETMPNAFKLSQEAQVFDRHFSGSNDTRYGIFSMFYGIPGFYFLVAMTERKGPVLIDAFLEEGYQMGIYSSALLTQPEFDRTVFAHVTNLRTKSKGGNEWLRDRDMTSEWLRFVDQRSPDKPFFGFLFYDAPHGYAMPPDYPRVFEPFWETPDYFQLTADTDPTSFKNRYRVSAHYVDSLIGEVLSDLQKRGLLQNTLVIFTSDHGQEFNDNKMNYWGHNSNFSDAQTHVPFFIFDPKRTPQHHEHLTSHYDIPVTLLEEMFGVSTPRASYSLGKNIYEKQDFDWIFQGHYNSFAVRTPTHLISMPFGRYYEVTDHHLKTQEIPADLGTISRAFTESRRYR